MSRRREDYATSRSTLNIDLEINSVELRYESRLTIDLCTYLDIFKPALNLKVCVKFEIRTSLSIYLVSNI